MNEAKPNKVRLGEIFHYLVKYFDEDEKKEIIEKKEAFFIKVDKEYYLINKVTNEDGSGSIDYVFFCEISGMNMTIPKENKRGKTVPREGKAPFTLIEALKFLKIKNVTPTGNFVSL